MMITRSFLLRMRNFSDRNHSQNTCYLCSITSYPKNLAIYEMVWKIIQRMHISYRITKAIYTQLRTCNMYDSSTLTMVTRTRSEVTFYVHYLVVKCFNEDAPVKHVINSISWHFSAIRRSSKSAEGLVEFSFVNKRMVMEIICPHDCITRLHFHKTAIESGTKCFYNTGLFEMIVGVLTTCHTQCT